MPNAQIRFSETDNYCSHSWEYCDRLFFCACNVVENLFSQLNIGHILTTVFLKVKSLEEEFRSQNLGAEPETLRLWSESRRSNASAYPLGRRLGLAALSAFSVKIYSVSAAGRSPFSLLTTEFCLINLKLLTPKFKLKGDHCSSY